MRQRDLSTALPDDAIAAIREVIPALDRQLKGFAMHHAVLTGVETRTSLPSHQHRLPEHQNPRNLLRRDRRHRSGSSLARPQRPCMNIEMPAECRSYRIGHAKAASL